MVFVHSLDGRLYRHRPLRRLVAKAPRPAMPVFFTVGVVTSLPFRRQRRMRLAEAGIP